MCVTPVLPSALDGLAGLFEKGKADDTERHHGHAHVGGQRVGFPTNKDRDGHDGNHFA